MSKAKRTDARTILLYSMKGSLAFDVPSRMFESVKNALTMFCLAYPLRKPSHQTKVEFLERLGFMGRKCKVGQNNSKIVFKYYDELAMDVKERR